MCDERERLIGYLYDESDPAERRQVQAHLDDCHVCRAEMAGLRRVREDLLAWGVPDHEPVWRPVVQAPPVPWWQQIPVWGLAAAASLVFVAGLGGGLATRVLRQGPAVPTAAVMTDLRPATPVAAPVGDDLTALEERLLARLRTEMQQQVRAMSSREVAAPRLVETSSTMSIEALRRQVADIERWRNDQIVLNLELDRKMNRLSTRTSTLDSQVTSWGLSGLNTLRVNNMGSEGR